MLYFKYLLYLHIYVNLATFIYDTFIYFKDNNKNNLNGKYEKEQNGSVGTCVIVIN